MGEQRVKKVSEEEILEQAKKQLAELKQVKEKIKSPKKVKIQEPLSKITEKPTVKKPKKQKIHSKKYQEAKKMIDKTKAYSVEEAIQLAQKTSYAKFNGSIEAHLRLAWKKGTKAGKIGPVRGLIEMPNLTGKKVRVAIIDEDLAQKILKTKKTDFDILLATPQMMPKIASLAKILGPKGLMPNPKSGTVTTDPASTMKKIQSGRIEYKSDKTGIIHLVIGKVKQDKKELVENFNALLAKIGKDKLQTIYICASMGPSIKVEF